MNCNREVGAVIWFRVCRSRH